MRARDKSNLQKVGVFITLLTLVFMVMVVAIGKESSIFEPRVIIKGVAQDAQNLKPGSVVELRGLRIGNVEDIIITGQEEIEIVLKITEKNLRWIRKDSKIEISNAGLVGDKYLQIKGGTQESGVFDPLKDVLQYEPSFDLKAMAQRGGNLADRAEQVLAKLDLLLAALDPQKLSRTLDGLSRTADNLSRATAPVEVSAQKMASTMGKLDAVVGRIQQGPGSAHSFIYDDALHADLRKLLGGAERNTVIKYFIRESIKKSPQKNE